MNAIYALYSDPGSAQNAYDALRRASSALGVDAGNVVVVTSEPYEGYEFASEHAKTHMFPLAALGGLVGGSFGYWLTSFTQTSYPLPTGGMPIVTGWTNGIIIYELTMLGAILTTLLTLLITAGLPNFKPALSDPEIWTGKILVGVTDPPAAARSELEAKLRQAGALAVKEFPPPSAEA
ncbi:MAG TPA: quinol:electron acceptor oxidoreductase subunit ActD [Candidatus Acidoferrales bacterium]|nr:quinol:electron acceptor oxidoreductase subunit ActD [Candidatus Acidoferrales bacterium]